ncbi:2,3-bisphosphoglycerate-independent phosphoglycerate mutase [Candidatus Bathyarchaeota archaeon]|nr:2,3-bisphosphoglycerate-independent phosphoglycerate mutase [Candidatus Bathyarchaeota archaeon]
MRKKIILVVLDGGADRPIPALEGKTPLMVARTPWLDMLADQGTCGLMNVLDPGIPPGSDTAQMVLLGYDPTDHYTGRGALEAIGGGIDVDPGDLCFRANFATVNKTDEGLIVVDRRAGRNIPEISEILDAITGFTSPHEGIDTKLIHTTQHRGALLLRGKNLSLNFADTDPHKVNAPLHRFIPREGDEGARRVVDTIHAYQDYIFEKLHDHPVNQEREKNGRPPVNMVLFREPAFKPDLQAFKRIHGMNGAFVCGNALISGVCLAANLHPAMTVDDLDFKRKVDATFNALEMHDFVFLHVKETDNTSHDHDVSMKVRLLEDIDASIMKPLMEANPKNLIIAVTADHVTSSVLGEHCGDAVPVAIWCEGIRRDSVIEFNEASTSRGGLCVIQGKFLLQILKNMAGLMEKFHVVHC